MILCFASTVEDGRSRAIKGAYIQAVYTVAWEYLELTGETVDAIGFESVKEQLDAEIVRRQLVIAPLIHDWADVGVEVAATPRSVVLEQGLDWVNAQLAALRRSESLPTQAIRVTESGIVRGEQDRLYGFPMSRGYLWISALKGCCKPLTCHFRAVDL